jgi:C_GCAxxG_C_C family probable redox protein
MTPDLPGTAAEHFAAGFSCSQAILLAYGERLGLAPADACRVAAGFGGGMARTGRLCGAVTGGMMALGLAFGGTSPIDGQAKEKTYAAVQEFLAQFEARHGSIRCPELLGYDLSKPEEAAAARRAGAVGRVCPGLVRSAAALLDEVMARRG